MLFDVESITSLGAVDCGATCLKMLLAFYGTDVDLSTLVTDCGTNPIGCTAAGIKRAGIKHGLDIKAYSMSADELVLQDRPAIIHWKGTHFCVFCGTNKEGKVVICNPDRGRYPIPINSFAKFYTGVALFNGEPITLEKEKSFEEKITILEDSVGEIEVLKEQNQMLIECIMELADIIYA